MARRFTELAFTPSVKAAQEHYGTRSKTRALERSVVAFDRLTERETEFVRQRDGFYQATVGQNGWPYVQYRGGPKGFLKVLDRRTLGYADFRGNLQYISVGNLNADDRVALILMDYANRSRLKIWAHARVVDASKEPQLIETLSSSNYVARIERAIVLSVEAFDWNCPQHITPRSTEEELSDFIEPLRKRIAELEIEVTALRKEPEGSPVGE